MELIQQLMQQLNVSEDQAKGGAGLVFDMIKSKLGDSEFSQVTAAIPEAQTLAAAAPAKSGVGSALGGLMSSLTSGQSGAGSLMSLAGGFSDLGLDSGMIGRFWPIIASFAQSRGGDMVKGLLDKVIK